MAQMIHLCKICDFYTVYGVASVMAASNFIGCLKNKGMIVRHSSVMWSIDDQRNMNDNARKGSAYMCRLLRSLRYGNLDPATDYWSGTKLLVVSSEPYWSKIRSASEIDNAMRGMAAEMTGTLLNFMMTKPFSLENQSRDLFGNYSKT
uniref:Uncharacterized protein n=1 Tax=Romanomermis culicivorax TaxID=13658 RepID=A0A915J6E4_ROMCU